MFPARYFAPRFFGPRYWGEVGETTVGQYFALRYFGGRYFAPGYWHKRASTPPDEGLVIVTISGSGILNPLTITMGVMGQLTVRAGVG